MANDDRTSHETWYVHQDDATDDLGGWCVLTVDRPPPTLTGEDVGAGRRLVADFVSEADARRIADLHNAEVMFVCESCPDDGWGCCGSWNDGTDRRAFVAGRRRERERLTAAGRLLPDGGETRTDWGMRARTGKIYRARDEADARDLAARHAARGVTIVQRTVWTGPWVEVGDA